MHTPPPASSLTTRVTCPWQPYKVPKPPASCALHPPPNPARVVLGPRDHSIPLVVEGTGEDLVGVALELLKATALATVP